MDRHSLSRDEVASRLTTELEKTISAKAVTLNRNWPIPNSWCEALARSEHAPPEAEPSLYVRRSARPLLAFSSLAKILRSEELWWLLGASVLSVLLGVAIALTV
jgi:hypothetical protein